MMPFFFEKWKHAQDWMKSTAFPAIQSVLFNDENLKIKTYRILCIDDDSSFCLFVKRLGGSLGIHVEIAHSCEEAKNAIENYSQFDAFIIDGHLPDGSGFELVAWLREKKQFTTPIGFISRIYHDAASFRLLKETFKVDFVLEKPIQPAEIYQLLIQMCCLKPYQIENEPFPNNLLEDLKAAYLKTIPDKVERLEKSILAIQKEPSIENLQTLKIEVHKIAGSAGSYGYGAVSDICKNLEEDLNKQITLSKKKLLNPQWLFSLEDFFNQIKLHFQIEFPKSELLSPTVSHSLPSIYIVDDDESLGKALSTDASQLHYSILIESRPDKAIQKLLAADFYPQILVLNAQYKISFLNGYDLIKAYYQRNDYLTTIIALLVESESLDVLVEALKRGITFISTRPFFPSLLLPLLDQIPFRSLPLHYKILVVDEDNDICQYILQTLNYIGLEIKILGDLQNLESIICNYDPDLILVDIHLIHETGKGILEWIRNILRYKKLLVAMLSVTQQDIYLLQKCYEFNVDEILFKPLDRGVLQRKIAYLFKNQSKAALGAIQSSKIDLDNVQTLNEYFNQLQQHLQNPLPKVLCMFEVSESTSTNSKLKKEIVLFVSQAFEELLKKYELAFYLGRGQFALVYQGYDPFFIQLFMRNFLWHLQENLEKKLFKHLTFHIHGGVVLLSKNENADMILQRAKNLLEVAKRQQVTLLVEPAFIPAKEVLIFHELMQSVDFLKQIFENQNFKVDIFTNWEEKDTDFYSRKSIPLLILNRKFLDGRGVFFLKKLFMANQAQIPILYLSHLFKIENLQYLLERINYFEEPFGLVILLP